MVVLQQSALVVVVVLAALVAARWGDVRVPFWGVAGALCGFAWVLFALEQWRIDSVTIPHTLRRAKLERQAPRIGRERLAPGKLQFVSSDACRGCHPQAYHTWRQTYHRTMTQLATPENVLGDFSDTPIRSGGLDYRVFRRGDEFWAEMPDPDLLLAASRAHPNRPLESVLDLAKTPRVERQVVMTTGSHHYQTYWVRSEKFSGVLNTLPLIYLPQDKRWIPREAAFMIPPDDPVRLVTIWNDHCIKCHSTGWNPNVSGPRSFDTEVAEMGIACEACHGPAEKHVALHRNPLLRYERRLGWTTHDDPLVNPAELDHVRSSQICGQCHGVYIWRDDENGRRYMVEGDGYLPGEDLNDYRQYIEFPGDDATPQELADYQRNQTFFRERWWDDGTILAGGREYTALQRTPCYTRGPMSCLSCHSMHNAPPADQLAEGMTGSQACTQCHDGPEYAANLASHTHHGADSTGSECLNCHMPHTSYALFGALRNHTISVPTIQQSAVHGVPNACNLCHLDKSLAWTQQSLAAWYGHEPVPLDAQSETISAAVLWLLKGNAAQRVVAAWHFGWGPAQRASGTDWAPPLVGQLLVDPYGVVRKVAQRSLGELPDLEPFEFDFAAPLEELQQQAGPLLDAWSALQTGVPGEAADAQAVLRDAMGRFDRRRADEILSQRDDRPVRIKE